MFGKPLLGWTLATVLHFKESLGPKHRLQGPPPPPLSTVMSIFTPPVCLPRVYHSIRLHILFMFASLIVPVPQPEFSPGGFSQVKRGRRKMK